jgi:7-cyano-7-deazaguanine synthase
MKKAVVLLSGGMDSATCLAYAISKGYACYALSVDYGQKQLAELHAAKKIAQFFHAKKHEIIHVPFGRLGGSALTDEKINVPKHEGSTNIPVTYVPARNTILLSIALGWAEILGANTIFAGMSSVDYSGYPDCRPEYVKAFQALANLATKSAIEGHPIRINTPLIYLSKAETIQLGNKLNVDYSMTVTCYQADSQGHACGYCDSCILRKKGFEKAGLQDPTRYQKNN